MNCSMQRSTAVVCFAAESMIQTSAMMKASDKTIMFTRTLCRVQASAPSSPMFHYQLTIHSLLSIRRRLLLVNSKESPSLDGKQDDADASEQVGAKARYGDCDNVRRSEGEHASEKSDDCELCEDSVDADIAGGFCNAIETSTRCAGVCSCCITY
jgi:hypothetical protein